MIHLDGIDYMWMTPSENTKAMVDFINNEAIKNNITNRKGEIIHIDINMGSPIYIMLFGVGYLVSIIQRLIYSIGCGLSISSSSDRQMLDLAEVAGLTRKPASQTTITATIFAEEDHDCVITSDYTYTINNIKYHPSVITMTVPMGKSKVCILVSEVPCSEVLEEVPSARFDEMIEGFLEMHLEQSIPGKGEETNGELRSRLQKRGGSLTQVDRAIDAIINLPGVTLCNIWFNPSIDATIEIRSEGTPEVGTEYIKNPLYDDNDPQEGVDEFIKNPDYIPSEEGRVIVSVPPRKAALIIQGYNKDIPDIFYAHMSCLTAKGVDERTIEMKHVTKSHQEIPFYFLTPLQKEVFISLYVPKEYTLAMKETIKNYLILMNPKLTIGQAINVGDVYNYLLQGLPNEMWKNIELSLDNSSWSYEIIAGPDELFYLTKDNIFFIEEL